MGREKMQQGKAAPLLEVHGLTCRRHGKNLLDAIDFSLYAGESLGILGFRASGRSLLLETLAGTVRCKGSIQLDGVRPGILRQFYKALGLVTEKPSLFLDLKGIENIDLISSLKAVKDTDKATALLERLELIPYLKQKAGTLEPGVYQRLALACALLNQPKLLLMDDVLYGLDSLSRTLLKKELARFSEDGGTLIWMVHTPEDLREVQKSAWMEQGKLTFLPPADIASRWKMEAFSGNGSTAEAGEHSL